MLDDTLRADRELAYLVRRLRCGASVLYVGAHPDDEEGGLIAMLAHGHGARVVFWSATRGEGGQNWVTPYSGRELGVYRTWESLAARAIDGGESLFGPFYDFGYSKTGAEALEKWGRQALVRELVRAIRLVQPQIVISCWRGDASDGHGHHIAVGIAVREAFALAADAASFPELEAVGLVPWQPRKLYVAMKGDWQPGESVALGVLRPDLEADGCLRVNVGAFDPIAGLTFQQQGALSLNTHLSQGASVPPDPGDYYLYLRLDDVAPGSGLEGRREIFDGVGDGLAALGEYPGGGDPELHAELEQITALAVEAAAALRVDAPWGVGPGILELARRWAELEAHASNLNVDADARRALASLFARRRAAAEAAAAACLGLRLHATVDRPSFSPGDVMHISAQLRSYGPEQPTTVDFEPLLDFEGAGVRRLESAVASAWFEVRIPEAAPLSCPYWLREAPGRYSYNWPPEVQAGTPFGEPFGAVRCDVEIAGRTLRLTRPALYAETFKGGYRELGPGILPPVSVEPKAPRRFVAARASPQALDVGVAINGHRAAPDATLRVAAPPGWSADPNDVSVPMRKAGEADAVAVNVTVPGGTPAGWHRIRYGMECDRRLYEASLASVMQTAAGLGGEPDAGTCIRREYIADPAVIDVGVIDVAVHEAHRYAYISGVRDEVPRILRDLGLRVDELDDEVLARGAFGGYDTIVVGPNAFVVRRAARHAARRLLAYANEGGTLLVQHQGYAHEHMNAAPFAFRYRQPHDRVTLETMPVRILRPDHFALRFPNQIVPADFDGWVTDRGLYFFSEWSDQYEALLGCADPGEEEKQGGLLIAECGHGTYVYCGYSLFRQLSAGVPGAFRLFANLLALPEARNTTAYVGRELEQSLLVGTFERAAQQRSCQLVTIVGESGMGKSRLCAELLGLTEDHPRPIRWRQGHCLPYGEGVAFWALGEIVKAECGILESDSAEQAQAKLEGALPAGDPEVAWLRARLEPLIGVGGEAASVEESFTAWRRVLEGWSEARETILVFEDLHWADDALLSFLEHLADWAQHVPLLLLCTARPELYERHPNWAAGLRNATTINLVPLSDEDTARLIARLLERAVLPAETQRALLERAGGNPLFAEEFVRLLADSGSRLSAVEQVPETVQALIAARLDTLSPERKDLLERAAILGKAFWVGALVAMGAGQPRDVELALHELARKGIVRRVRTSSMEGQAEYEFWHLLVRDVCYAQMPPMARAARHRVAARWLEDTLGDRAEDGADVLAHHYLQALELSRAADEDAVFEELEGAARRCLVLAGERALALDGASALASFARALELVPSGHTDRASVLERYGHAAHIAGRPQEARAALEEAIALHKEQQDALAAGRGLTLLVPVLWALGDPRRTEVGAEAVALLEQEPAGPELVAAYAQQSGVHVISSELPEAVATAARAVECAVLLGLPEPARALGFGGSARAYMGDRRGLDEMRRALALAVERGRSDDAGVVYANLGLLIWEHEGARSAYEHFEAGAAFCERRGAAGNLLYIRVLSLVALAASGHPGQALTRIQALGEQEEAIGFIPLLVELMSLKLRLRAARGECAGVAREPEETAARARETGVPSTIAIGLNAASDVLLATNRREEALACLVELADGPGLAGLSAELPFQVPQFVRNVLALSAPELALRVTEALNPTTPLREHSVVTCRALLAEHAGELAHAAELFEDAAERWRRLTGEPERAYALLGQGRCLLGLGEARGGGPLREAAQLFASLGYRPALAETEALLRDYEATAV